MVQRHACASASAQNAHLHSQRMQAAPSQAHLGGERVQSEAGVCWAVKVSAWWPARPPCTMRLRLACQHCCGWPILALPVPAQPLHPPHAQPKAPQVASATRQYIWREGEKAGGCGAHSGGHAASARARVMAAVLLALGSL